MRRFSQKYEVYHHLIDATTPIHQTRAQTHKHTHKHACIHTCIHACMHTLIYMHACISSVYACMYTYTHACKHNEHTKTWSRFWRDYISGLVVYFLSFSTYFLSRIEREEEEEEAEAEVGKEEMGGWLQRTWYQSVLNSARSRDDIKNRKSVKNTLTSTALQSTKKLEFASLFWVWRVWGGEGGGGCGFIITDWVSAAGEPSIGVRDILMFSMLR